MIVARICKDNKTIVETGGCKIARYEGKSDGWFPINSFDFGLNKKDEGSKAPGKPPAAHKTGANAPAAAPAAGKEGDAHVPEVTISKLIDTASCSLMMLVMEERGNKKGVGEKATPLTADIHVISSVSLEKLQKDRFLYTSLMIHLESVDIKSWKIQSSGERPTENVTLRYDKAAMIYVPTTDGRTFGPKAGPYGYDQTTNGPFDWTSGWQQYLPPI